MRNPLLLVTRSAETILAAGTATFIPNSLSGQAKRRACLPQAGNPQFAFRFACVGANRLIGPRLAPSCPSIAGSCSTELPRSCEALRLLSVKAASLILPLLAILVKPAKLELRRCLPLLIGAIAACIALPGR